MDAEAYRKELLEKFDAETARVFATLCPICHKCYGVHDGDEMRICFPALCEGYRPFPEPLVPDEKAG